MSVNDLTGGISLIDVSSGQQDPFSFSAPKTFYRQAAAEYRHVVISD